MTLTTTSSASGVDLTARLHGLHPVTVRAPTLPLAARCMRSILADERRKLLASLDAVDAQLAALDVRRDAMSPGRRPMPAETATAIRRALPEIDHE